LLWEKKRTKLWIVFMSLRLEILLHKDMKGLEQRHCYCNVQQYSLSIPSAVVDFHCSYKFPS
jgi:hypothetical protein